MTASDQCCLPTEVETICTENQEIDPLMHAHEMDDKVDTAVRWENDRLFSKWCWVNWILI